MEFLKSQDGGAAPDDRGIRFGPFCLRPAAQLLLEGDKPVHIGARALDLLIVLVENAGRMVAKEELLSRVWPHLIVEEGNLTTQVALLRKALRDGRAGAGYVKTVSGRGYCFVAPLATTEPKPIEPPRSSVEAVAGLPARLTPLFGRAEAVRDILDRLHRRRFVTIVGPGGIGKTSVGFAVAEQAGSLYDGVALVDCAPLLGTTLVPQKLAATLGLDIAGDDPTRGLTTYLRDKRILILLDCCEHVIEAAAVLAENLLRGAASVGILATSREPLRAEGENVYRLAPLEVPPASIDLSAHEALTYPAVELFVDRVRSSVGQFELQDSNAPIVSEICRRLDGIALAIELAAGRVNVFGLAGLAARLEDRVRLLKHGRRTALPRHQTLTAALDWSFEALSETEQVVLRRLSVFAGGFTLEAAQAVAQDDLTVSFDIVEIIESLVSKSLLNADVAGAIGHYRPLDMTRAYALQKLAESGEFFETTRRHAVYILSLLEATIADLPKISSSGAAVRLTADSKLMDEARAAIDRAFAGGGIEHGVTLTVASIPHWTALSLQGECRRYVHQALLAGKPSFTPNDPREMRLLAALGTALVWTGGPVAESDAAFAGALEIAESLDDADYQIRVLWGLWSSHFNSGRIRLSLDTAKRFRDVSAKHGDTVAALVGERTIGMSLFYMGDHSGARRHAELLLGLYVRPQDRSHVVRFQFDPRLVARTLRSKLLWAQGFPDQAMQEVMDSIDEAVNVGHPLSLALALAQGACPVMLQCGDWIEAERFINLLLKHSVDHALDLWHDWARCFRAELLIARGDSDEGLRALKAVLDELPISAFFARYAGLRATLAETLGRVGAISDGLAVIDEALIRAERQGECWYMAEFLRIKGELLQLEETPTATQEAHDHFLRSVQCARQQEALSWELRSSMSLARLFRGRGQMMEARDVLGPVYTRFNEGFATADLRAAKALMNELA